MSELESRELRKLKLAILHRLSNEFFTDEDDATLRVSNQIDFLSDCIAVMFHAKVWSEEAGTYQHPQNWWNMLKAQLFPYWLKRLMPVKYKTVTFSCLYPLWKPALEDEPNKMLITIESRI